MCSNNQFYISQITLIMHYVSVKIFTIRTGILPSGIPITGTSYYFYMVALADWVTMRSQYPIGETFQPDAADNVEV